MCSIYRVFMPAPLSDLAYHWWQPDELLNAFRRVKKNRGAPGLDGESIADIERELPRRMAQLSDQLRKCTLRPLPHLLLSKTKPHGGVRRIAIAAVVDRIWQTALSATLMRHWEPEMSGFSYAYRPGRSVEDACLAASLLVHRGYAYAWHVDIRNYFDSIPHVHVLNLLDQSFPCPVARSAIERWLHGYARDRRWRGGSKQAGLPQGSPLSPVLSNHLLTPLDKKFGAGKRYRLIRYADNILLLGKSAADANTALQLAMEHTAPLGLTLAGSAINPTNISRDGGKMTFLGYYLGGRALLVRSC